MNKRDGNSTHGAASIGLRAFEERPLLGAAFLATTLTRGLILNPSHDEALAGQVDTLR